MGAKVSGMAEASPFERATPLAVVEEPDEIVHDNGAEPDTPPAEPEVDEDAWTHETVEFLGDTLEVRKPSDQAMAAFSLATSKYVSPTTRNDMTNLFIMKHLSESSYDRVFGRLMDPDDEDYSLESIGKLVAAIVALKSSNDQGS